MPNETQTRAVRTIERCRELARITDVPGETTRLFLSEATRDAHALLLAWMAGAGLETRTDDAGNVRGLRLGAMPNGPTLLFFSHIDTVPNAGAFDGPLGVLLALTVIEELATTPLPFDIELIAFSEEEGARFSFPFLSSLAVTGQLTEEHLAKQDAAGVSVKQALRNFGLHPERIAETCALPAQTFAALEVHIEQGPVLEAEDMSLAVVESIVGQSRFLLTFTGHANHAGTTPMALRKDALAATAQWIAEVERYALDHKQLVATVGHVEVLPGAANVVPGLVRATLDVRHPSDASRHAATAVLLTKAEAAGELRGVRVKAEIKMQQNAVPMDHALTTQLADAAERAGFPINSMFSGAGHDAMILAPHVPTTMLFLRSPNGLSHHPDETVREQDVEAAIATVLEFVTGLRPPQ
ncbi:MAG TPA: allantoate amidohydrolase [Acidobacteriaceae bacterium]|nr:allantoate amidohydrolase [Acidobacteriaceae bacterium]